ncbi:unnamed protein product, partial [Dovyalis caffra]
CVHPFTADVVVDLDLDIYKMVSMRSASREQERTTIEHLLQPTIDSLKIITLNN